MLLDSVLYSFKKEKTPKNGAIANAKLILKRHPQTKVKANLRNKYLRVRDLKSVVLAGFMFGFSVYRQCFGQSNFYNFRCSAI